MKYSGSFSVGRTTMPRMLIYRSIILWVVLELAAAAQVRGPSGATVLASWARAAFTPPVTLLEWTALTLSDLTTGFADARVLATENQSLVRKLSNLQSQNVALRTDLSAALQAAEGLQALPLFSGIPARCLYRDLGRGLLLVTIDPASSSMISHDTPALATGGVIGRVIRVEGRSCWIESLTRETAAVAVVTDDGSIHGLAEGTGSRDLAVRFVSHRATLTVGQELLTSGADGIYPPGFPVAVVTSIHEGGGPFLEIAARPISDPTTAQSVWLIHSGIAPGGPEAPRP